MAKVKQDFELWQGDSPDLEVTVVDGSGKVIDLTGATLVWKLVKANTVDLTKDTTTGITITDAVNGVFTVKLNDTDTLPLTGIYTHEAHITDIRGYKSTIMTGKVTVHESH